MNEVYIEGRQALMVGGKPKADNTIHKETNSSVCVFSRAQKLPQSTWLAEIVISSSLTPQAALLVPVSGPIDHVVDHHSLTGLAKDRP